MGKFIIITKFCLLEVYNLLKEIKQIVMSQ